jgi:hypothetical protein
VNALPRTLVSVGRRGQLLAALAAALALAGAGCGESETGSAESAPPADRGRESTAVSDDRPAGRRDRAAGDERLAPPTALEIPAIGVRAPVIRLGLNRDKSLEVPSDYGDTGWWSGGFSPGERGPAVIVGHVDSEDGPAVFYELDRLERGDRITVRRRDGSAAAFAVERIERHPKDDFPTPAVYGRTADSTLRLVTCSGDFDESTGHYVDNTIVFAKRA